MNHIFSTLKIHMNKLSHFEIALKSQGLNGKSIKGDRMVSKRETLFSQINAI